LSDDELFGLKHILKDQSREPIAAYLTALIERDRERTLRILDEITLTGNAEDGVLQLSDRLLQKPDDLSRRLLIQRVRSPGFGRHTTMRLNALRTLTEQWWGEEMEQLLKELAIDLTDERVRQDAVERLIARSSGPSVRAYLVSIITRDTDRFEVVGALLSLMAHWPDDETWLLMSQRVALESDNFMSEVILPQTSSYWNDERTRQLLIDHGLLRADKRARPPAIHRLLKHWPDDVTRKALERVSREDLECSTRVWVLSELARQWPESTVELLRKSAMHDTDESVRKHAVELLLHYAPAGQQA
jgi:hypothetical protein